MGGRGLCENATLGEHRASVGAKRKHSTSHAGEHTVNTWTGVFELEEKTMVGT